jgi:hypothetical protein
MSADSNQEVRPPKASDPQPFTGRQLIVMLAKCAAVGLGVGLFCVLVAHYFVDVGLAWAVGAQAALATSIAMTLKYVQWQDRISMMLHIALIGGIAVAALATSIAGGIVRYHTEAPARAAAAARQAPIDRANARYNAAVSSARSAFESQGFKMSDQEDPSLELNRPDLTSGNMYVIISISTGWSEAHLLISEVNGVWIAGCPTRVAGVMYPLGADRNKLATTLAISGQCPPGLDPPRSGTG